MKQKFIMMVGLPASGKSTKAQEICDRYNAIGESCAVFSSDKIREEILGDINDQSRNNEVFEELHKRVLGQLADGKHAIFDATNISYKRRIEFLRKVESKKKNIEKICILMAVPMKECCSRNNDRERKVPLHAMERMYTCFDVPYWYEGWDDIIVEYPDGWWGNAPFPLDYYEDYLDYDQQNPHHTKTLGKHLISTYNWVDKYIANHPGEFTHDSAVAMRIAAVLHDCGKPYTLSFGEDKDGVTVAHYYQHQHCGSYDSLLYRSTIGNVGMLHVATLIRWHMQPFSWENGIENRDKIEYKYRKLWGNNLFKEIEILHRADIASK